MGLIEFPTPGGKGTIAINPEHVCGVEEKKSPKLTKPFTAIVTVGETFFVDGSVADAIEKINAALEQNS